MDEKERDEQIFNLAIKVHAILDNEPTLYVTSVLANLIRDIGFQNEWDIEDMRTYFNIVWKNLDKLYQIKKEIRRE